MVKAMIRLRILPLSPILPAFRRLAVIWLATSVAAGVPLAAKDDAAAPADKLQAPVSEQMMPIPGYSPSVEDNGCELHSNPSQPAPPGKTARGIPLFALISDAVGRYAVEITIADGDPRAAFNARLDSLDAKTRTLATLYALHDHMGRDGLHTYFFMRGGSVAFEVRDALAAAGLTRDYDLFNSAMALFGQDYPLDDDQRAAYFGYSGAEAKLNAFDDKMLSIAAQFPNRDAFADEIEGYVRQHPKLWQRIEESRKKLSGQRRLGILIEQLWDAMPSNLKDEDVAQALAKLPEAERNVLALDAFNSEFENGGVHQFFFNSTGAYAPEAHDAMLAMGLARQARLLEQAMGLFSKPYARNRETRAASYRGGRDVEGFESELSDLTDAFYEIEGGPQVTHLGGSTQITGGPGIRAALERYASEQNLLPC